MQSVQNVKRGDVVHDFLEFVALPVGTVLTGIGGDAFERMPSDGPGRPLPQEAFPALVRVVGPGQPEWLEAAAREARAVDTGRDDWDNTPGGLKLEWRNLARAAVAAADKARGIVNTREEFDALPIGARLIGKSKRGGWYDGTITGDYVPEDMQFPMLLVDGGAA